MPADCGVSADSSLPIIFWLVDSPTHVLVSHSGGILLDGVADTLLLKRHRETRAGRLARSMKRDCHSERLGVETAVED